VNIHESIAEMQPGRDLDGAIAERLLGYHLEIVPRDGSGENGGNEYLVPPNLPKDYQLPPKGAIHFAFHAPLMSTDIRSALWLWDQLANRGWQCSLVHKPFEKDEDNRWVFHGVNRKSRHGDGFQLNPEGPIFVSFSAHAKSRELAICRGALESAEKAGA
jgi:hypothetical protein